MNPNLTVAVVSTIRNEGAHLEEWLRYHQAIGVTRFFIFDHESDDDTPAILSSWNSNVVWSQRVSWDGSDALQIRCLREVHDQFLEYDWVASLDGDELIVPLTAWTLTDLIKNVPSEASGVVMNWKHFGERDQKNETLASITRCSAPEFDMNRGFKCLARTSALRGRYYSVHHAPVDQTKAIHDFGSRADFDPVCGWRTQQVSHRNVQVNHFKWRSAAELKSVADRGRCFPSTGGKGFTLEQWRSYTNVSRDYRLRELWEHHRLSLSE